MNENNAGLIYLLNQAGAALIAAEAEILKLRAQIESQSEENL